MKNKSVVSIERRNENKDLKKNSNIREKDDCLDPKNDLFPYVCNNTQLRQMMAIKHEKKKDSIVNPFRIYQFPTTNIQHVLTAKKYKNQMFYDYEHEGDWDVKAAKIHDMLIYHGLKQRFFHGYPWSQNVLSPKNVESIDWPEPSQYTKFTEIQFRKRAKELDNLWNSLRQHGNLYYDKTTFSDILAVAIGRNGEIMRMCSGLHRLIMSKILNFEYIPGRVSIIHKYYDQNNYNYDISS